MNIPLVFKISFFGKINLGLREEATKLNRLKMFHVSLT